jgi:thioesterase domain-containing protein/aryl carrier-like protein
LLHYLNGILPRLDLPAGASFATVSTLAADLGNTAIFPALSSGGCLHVVTQERASDPDALAAYVCLHTIDCLKIVPSYLETLLLASHPEQILPRKRLVLGGEASSWTLIDKVQELSPNCVIINHYGPTETTIGVTTYLVAKSYPGDRPTTPPIGRPIANVQVYVLDSHLQPVPIWVPGELYIGGDGLARGYYDQPELTAEKFIPNPFSSDPGARLYKTGDRVHYLPDGNIEFVGRIDHQVKIRGFRIELGEIETVLSQHPAVREAVVIAREESDNLKSESENSKSAILNSQCSVKRLVAYVVPRQEGATTINELRSFVKEKLPEHMVPSEFVFLDRLPLTQNGKLDRTALLAARPTPPNREETFTPARDELELQLTQIWERILRTRPIGLKDNFFDLGGHSLLAVRLISQVKKLTGQRLSLASLFQAPTIEDQAKVLRREGWSAPWSSLVAIQPGGSKPPFFCVHAHDGNVLFWRELSRRLGPDQPFYGLQAHGLDGEQAPDTRVEDMASRYVREIRLLQPEGPYFLGGHCLGGVIAFEMAQQLHAQDQRVALLALIDSFAPLGKQTMRRRTPLRHRVERALALTRQHIDNLRLLGWDERFSYIEVKFNRLLYKSYMGVGASWVLTAQARRRILAAGAEARRSYAPKVYPGSVTLFRATEIPRRLREEPQGRWGKLVAGGLEVHLIPSYFSQTVYEPRVRMLAEKLTACLDSARATPLGDERKFVQG